MAKKSGLKVERKYTTPGNPYNNITWEKRSSKITNPDGSIVFEMNDVEIPSTWSQVATDIMVSKYFRKAGVPQVDAEGIEIKDENGERVLGPETSSRQVFDRLAETWRHWGEKPDILLLPKTLKHLKMNLNTCLQHKWLLQTVHSGLILD